MVNFGTNTKLVQAMNALHAKGLDCSSCSGECCTFVRNSMQVTPYEAIRLVRFLHRQKRTGLELIKKLKETVQQYRLDDIPGDGRRALVRRSYTCPFLKDGPKGCSISRSAKPFGCLAFNPTKSHQTESDTCRSDQNALEQVHRDIEDELELSKNELENLGVDTSNAPIPVALLRLLDGETGNPISGLITES